MITEAITIPRRFNGPPHSGNGGYVCGRLASYLDGPASVRLRVPPPLERELRVETTIGERCVVAAWAIGVEGRKHFAGSALYSAKGVPVAVARATWIQITSMPGGEA